MADTPAKKEIKKQDKVPTYVATVGATLVNMIDKQVEAMPKDFNKTRFVQNCLAVLRDTKGIEECEVLSVARCLIKGAYLGLDFFNKECYAIPYNTNIGTRSNPNWIKTVNFQTDYKGERKLAMRYSRRKIRNIYAKVVREGDDFVEDITSGIPTIHFKPKPFNEGDIVGAFAVCLYEDGTLIYETMPKSEIEHVKEKFAKKDSEGKFSKAWVERFSEMAKKTVLRLLCKAIDLDFETLEQRQAFDDASEFHVSSPKTAQLDKPDISALPDLEPMDAEIVDNGAVETLKASGALKKGSEVKNGD